jgi:hypothetical protein
MEKTKHGRFVAVGRRRGAEGEGDGGNHIGPQEHWNEPGCEKTNSDFVSLGLAQATLNPMRDS